MDYLPRHRKRAVVEKGSLVEVQVYFCFVLYYS